MTRIIILLLFCSSQVFSQEYCKHEDITKDDGTYLKAIPARCTSLDLSPTLPAPLYALSSEQKKRLLLGDDGAKKIANMLHDNNSIKFLSLHKNLIGLKGAKALANVLKNHNKTLKALDLSNNTIKSDGALEIVKSVMHKDDFELDLSLNGIDDNLIKGMDKLVEQDPNKTFNFETILLLNNFIKDEGARYLAKILDNHKHLKKLNLEGNDIKDSGAIALAEALMNHETLEWFGVAHNKIGKKGLKELNQSNEHNKKLEIKNNQY
ncbi:MAG: hypothetical protein ACON5A_01600 [Candidatus Comchoanobacterales bacterium]